MSIGIDAGKPALPWEVDNDSWRRDVAPLDAAVTDGVGAGGGVQRTPNAEALKIQGIGGLSFEIESCSVTPKMSYERSVCSNN